MKYRVLGAFAALLLFEVGFFYLRHGDVIALSRPSGALAADPAFATKARTVLQREQISRRVLERIADVAGRQNDRELQLAALDRIARRSPEEREVQLRRADVLRAMGRHHEAELVYAQVAASATPGERP
jgi:hypothetical protein